jgi:hypothetical protein
MHIRVRSALDLLAAGVSEAEVLVGATVEGNGYPAGASESLDFSLEFMANISVHRAYMSDF